MTKKEMDMHVQSYLFFEGRCDEALDFYRKVLGAEVTSLMRFKEAPGDHMPEGCGPMPEGNGDKVMHCSFRVGGTELMASDGMCSGQAEFKGVSLAITAADAAEVDKLCGALADGGKTVAPPAETFFSERFGMCMDRFGVTWMVISKNDRR